MMNERSSAQANTPTPANMQYGYPPGHFDLMNMPPIQNPNDLYSYYPPSLYQPFPTYDEHNQWGQTDTSGNVPPPPPGSMQYHPQMYTPSPLDIPRSPFDYPPLPHAYPHYHPGFTTSTFPGPPSTGTSAFDMSWTPHNLPMQQMQIPQQQMTPIGGGPALNKKPSVYDEYPVSGVGDMLAQHMNSVDLGSNNNNDDTYNYDNGTNDNAQNVNVLSSKDQQQHYQSNSSNISLSTRPSQASSSNGPKSYASVVSADTINLNSNKSTSNVPNMSVRSTVQSSTTERNNSTSNYSNDSMNSRSNTNLRGNNNNNNNTNNYSQQTRNGTSGYNPRNQQQQQQQSSSSGTFLNWTGNNLPSNSRGGGGGGGGSNNNNTSSNYYNSGSSDYYDRSSYSQQQQQTSSYNNNHNNNKRQNSNYQNYSSSRTTNNMSNGDTGASAIGQQPISAANQETLDTLKRNHQYNPREFNLNPKGARFFVIKSYSEDDVHRSIKYNIWCSTEHGNKRLDDAFREREGKGPIYLFYSVNASGHFCGMAEMMSPLDYEHKTDVWQMSNKWQGKFEVKWIYVKDVPNQQFRNIRLENNDNKPVTNSRDTQEIPYEKGKFMLKTMHMYRHKTSIFDDFQYYESKQAEEVVKKPSNNEFNNNNNNNTRGNNNNKRQFSSNKLSSTSVPLEQQQHQQQQQQNENSNNEDNN